ncbi:MAG: hypothetical protein AAGD22_11350 [Verrucomicrobiota bacterium]
MKTDQIYRLPMPPQDLGDRYALKFIVRKAPWSPPVHKPSDQPDAVAFGRTKKFHVADSIGPTPTTVGVASTVLTDAKLGSGGINTAISAGDNPS